MRLFLLLTAFIVNLQCCNQCIRTQDCVVGYVWDNVQCACIPGEGL